MRTSWSAPWRKQAGKDWIAYQYHVALRSPSPDRGGPRLFEIMQALRPADAGANAVVL